MSNRIKTSKQEIADYWKDQLHLTNVSYKEAHHTCWRCGIKKRLDRCHIIPRSKGGKDIPSNYILLCKHCHFENPNLDNLDIIWDWISAYKLEEDEDLWMKQGIREYQYIYGVSLDQELQELNLSYEDFKPYIDKELEDATVHFGQPSFNPATVAGAIRLAIINHHQGAAYDSKE